MTKFEVFNDGVVTFYDVRNIANAGERPVDGLVLKSSMRFAYSNISMRRLYDAMQENIKIDELIIIPQNRFLSTQDVAIVDNKQYRISQIQHINTTKPPISRISLERLLTEYDIT